MSNDAVKSGTAGGTLLTIIASIPLQDVGRTALMATVGAVVSYSVSLLLKMVTGKLMRK